MAGINPGLVIKVAADVRDAMAAFVDVIAASTNTATAVENINTAYGTLGSDGTADLRKLEDATKDVDDATGDVKMSVVALGTAIGSFAANAATALLDLAFDAIKSVGRELWDVIDKATGASDAWRAFKDEVAASVEQTGVFQAGMDALGRSLLEAFGGDRAALIRAVADLINAIGIKAVDVGLVLLDFSSTATRVFAALKLPIDLITVAINGIVTAFLDGLAMMGDAASHIPMIGDKVAGLTTTVRGYADSWREVRDRTLEETAADVQLLQGKGAVNTALAESKRILLDVKDAMVQQKDAATNAATATTALTDADRGLVQGSGEAVVALYNQNEQLAKMDEWSRNIKNKDPYTFLLQGLTKTLTPLEQSSTAMGDAAANAFLLGDHLSRTKPRLDEFGQGAIDMSEDVRFAAEVVARSTLSWSEAMDAVRRGEGTMTGTIGQPTKPAGMSDQEWYLVQNDPRQWEAMHAWDWQTAQFRRPESSWLVGGQPTATAGHTTNITVNTVAGDKQAIATVVKDALADDWRNQGRKG